MLIEINIYYDYRYIYWACATPSPRIDADHSGIYALEGVNVVVINYITKQKYNVHDHIWASGFHLLPYSSTTPDFNDLVFRRVSTEFVSGRNTGNSDLEIALLQANLYMESHIADTVLFVGMFSAFSERKYMCYVDANFKYEGRSVREGFESIATRTRSWGDLEENDKKN